MYIFYICVCVFVVEVFFVLSVFLSMFTFSAPLGAHFALNSGHSASHFCVSHFFIPHFCLHTLCCMYAFF